MAISAVLKKKGTKIISSRRLTRLTSAYRRGKQEVYIHDAVLQKNLQ